MQVSQVPTLVTYTPVQPVKPAQPVRREDDPQPADDKVKSSNPPGVGVLFDIRA